MSVLPVFDGCQVTEKLESGAITDWYRALQQPLGRPVFIKALSRSILPSSPFATSLEREARLLATLTHPNILGVHDFRRDAERMWLVLEHVDGWTLQDVLERHPQLSQGAATAVALQVTRALAHAHEKGIVHRDVRPANLRLTTTGLLKLANFRAGDGEGIPDATDFLGSKQAFHRTTYMSPEQILGESTDARSDIFALGVVLYEILAGKSPFLGPDAESTAQRIRHERPVPLGRHIPTINAALERTTLRCLQKLPSDRFSSALELAHALEGVLADLGGGESTALIRAELAEAGLAALPSLQSLGGSGPMGSKQAEVSLGRGVAGLLLASALILVGWAILRPEFRSDAGTESKTTEALPLVPENSAYLRVVAEPWAHVFVDGQKVETTPFARALPLSAGVHHVRLEHPHAPAERRTIRLVPGETLLLDVAMKVPLLSPRPSTSSDVATDGGYDDDAP